MIGMFPPNPAQPDFKFLITENSSYNFSVISDRAINYSRKLTALPKNSRIGLFTSHSENFMIGLLAIWYSGNVAIPLGNVVSTENLHQIIARHSLNFLIVDNFTAELPKEINHLNLDNTDKVFTTTAPPAIPDYDTIAAILLTSGSTGQQKEIPHSFQNFIASAGMLESALPDIHKTTFGATLPFFHIGGFSQIIRALYYNSPLYIPQKITSDTISEIAIKGLANTISIVPATLNQMLKENLVPHNTVRHIFVGGAASNSEDITSALQRGFPLYKVYGSTETCAMIAITTLEDLNNFPLSSGKAMEGVNIKIVDTNGNKQPNKTEGIIEISSPTLSPDVIEKNGYYKTGDIGYLDKKGNLVITGRDSRMIISGGYNINPVEIEDILLKLPSVSQAYVTAISDIKWGEKLIAAIVANQSADAGSILQHLKKSLPFYKIPKEIFSMPEFPLTALGKTDTKSLDKILLEKCQK